MRLRLAQVCAAATRLASADEEAVAAHEDLVEFPTSSLDHLAKLLEVLVARRAGTKSINIELG